MLDVHQAVQVKFTQNQTQNSSSFGYFTQTYIYICVYVSLKVLVLLHHCIEKQKACIKMSLYYLTIYI